MNNDSLMITPDARSWDPFIAMLRWGQAAFMPTFDVAEHASGYTIHAKVPGLRDEDFDITVEGNQLTISGERQAQRVSEDVYGKFVRTFSLPSDADLEAVTADLDYGVLYLSIPKLEEAKPRKISLVQRLKNKLMS